MAPNGSLLDNGQGLVNIVGQGMQRKTSALLQLVRLLPALRHTQFPGSHSHIPIVVLQSYMSKMFEGACVHDVTLTLPGIRVFHSSTYV